MKPIAPKLAAAITALLEDLMKYRGLSPPQATRLLTKALNSMIIVEAISEQIDSYTEHPQ
jgi:hypothetical protein